MHTPLSHTAMPLLGSNAESCETMQPTLKVSCSRLGLSLFAFIVVWNLCAILLAGLLSFLVPNWLNNSWSFLLLNDISLYGVGMPIFLWLISRIPSHACSQTPTNQLRVWQFFLVFLLCFSVMYGVGFLTEIFFYGLELIFGYQYTNSLNSLVDLSNWPSLLILGVAVPSVGEEFLFRHVFYKKLSVYGDKVYIIFSALCFGLFHINPSQILYAFLLGIILAGVYLRTKKLWIPILLHFLLNSLGLLVIPEMMTQYEIFASIFSISLVALFPVLLFLLFVLYRKLPAVPGIDCINARRSVPAQCLVNVGMLLYLSMVLFLLILRL